MYDGFRRRARSVRPAAVNHRAARFFDARAVPTLALKHAALAFGAVPSEAGTLPLLQRTAVRAGKESFAVRTVEQVAEQVAEPGQRAVWLLAASGLAADDAEGRLQRAEILLKAVVLRGGRCSPRSPRGPSRPCSPRTRGSGRGSRSGSSRRARTSAPSTDRRPRVPASASLAAGAFGDTAWALDRSSGRSRSRAISKLEALASLAPKLARDDGAGAFVERASPRPWRPTRPWAPPP